MDDRSSISPSEKAHTIGAADVVPDATGPITVDPDTVPAGARSRVPWALLLSLLILGGFEAWLRLSHWPGRVLYELNLQEYHAVAAAIDHYPTPDVAIVGSSRSRECVDLPKFRQALSAQAGRPVRVANYSVSGGRAYVIESITRQLLRQPTPPKLIIIGGAERDLSFDYAMYDQASLYWDFADWRREWQRRGRDVLEDLPVVVRNALGRLFVTLRFRDQLELKLRRLVTGDPSPPSQLDGELTLWQQLGVTRTRRMIRSTPRELTYYTSAIMRRKFPNVEMADALDRLAVACREKDVRLVIFRVPIAPLLEKNFRAGFEAQFDRAIKQVCARQHATFLRTESFGLNLTEWDFRDPSHLSVAGADQVGDALAKQIGMLDVDWDGAATGEKRSDAH